VIKHIYTSPVRSPHEIIPIFYNKSKFNALPDDLKMIVENVTLDEAYRYYALSVYSQATATKEIKKAGVRIEKLPSEIESAFMQKAREHYGELVAKDAFAKEVLDSLNNSISMFKEVLPEGL
jgi:TRAP-type mannitol/chloroaromatic compound transport system substrate-binding protein